MRADRTTLMIGVAALLTVSAAASASGDMSVATFLAKSDALKAKGIFALTSSDVALLKSEAKAEGAAYRKRIQADKANKRVSHSCPPAKTAMNSDDFVAYLRSYPESARAGVSVTTATADLMKKRYPCK
jgi:lipid-binding SYLF domain-containing protein